METQCQLFARQPIFDTAMNVVAYELLWRSARNDASDIVSGDQATSQVLLRAFTETDFQDVVGQCKAFVNFTRQLLLNPPPLQPNTIVIEVLEDIEADDQVLAALRKLKAAGHTLALDDFELSNKNQAMLDFADIVKLDMMALGREQLKQQVSELRWRGLTLLAEKVETQDDIEFARQLGFQLFQGFFLERPEPVRGQRINERRQSVLQLVARMHSSDIEIDEIESIITHDPALSYKLLRLINSAAFNLACKVKSLRQAITLLGIRNIQGWVSLLLLAGQDDKPLELTVVTLIRAKMCQKLGERIAGHKQAEAYFTLGLVSTFDAYLGQPLDEVIKSLSLHPTLVEGLLGKPGIMDCVLSAVKHHEHGNWDNIDWAFLLECGISARIFQSLYEQSLSWSDTIINDIKFPARGT